MKNSEVKPPKTLGKEARALWRQLSAEWEFDGAELAVLTQGLLAYQRMEQAREIVDREGLTLQDRFGQVKSHPCLLTERDARGQFLAAMKQLGLRPPGMPGRPAGSTRR